MSGLSKGLENGFAVRNDIWSAAIAVGSFAFVESVKNQLGVKASHRDVVEANGSYELREPAEAYGLKFAGEKGRFKRHNTFLWNKTGNEART